MKPTIKAVIFDMDGLLLDTEPLWGISMMAKVKQHGVPVTLQQFRATTGLRIDEVTAYWQKHFPWQSSISSSELAEDILDDIIIRAQKDGRILPGVEKLLANLKAQNVQTAVATSSPKRMATTLLNHFKIDQNFDAIISADNLPYGKPHPEVYITAAKMLGIAPDDCLALEDSVNGMIAARAARMRVIVVPDIAHKQLPEFCLAYKKLNSLLEWSNDFLY